MAPVEQLWIRRAYLQPVRVWTAQETIHHPREDTWSMKKGVISTCARANPGLLEEARRCGHSRITLSTQDYYKLPLSYLSSPIPPVIPIPRDLGVSGIYSTTLRGRRCRMRAGFHPPFPQESPCDTAVFTAELSCGPSGSCGITQAWCLARCDPCRCEGP